MSIKQIYLNKAICNFIALSFLLVTHIQASYSEVANEIGDNDFRISDMGPDANADYDAENPAIAYNSTNNEYLVVWSGDDNSGDLVEGEIEIWGQRINAETGAEIGSDFRISDLGPDGDTAYSALYPKVAYNSTNNEYLVVWHGDNNIGTLADNEYEMWGQRINAESGAEIGTNDFRISHMGESDGDSDYDASTRPKVVYNSTENEYFVVWIGDDNAGTLVDNENEVRGQRINAATGVEVGPNDIRISDMGPDSWASFDAVSAGVSFNSTDNEYLVIWHGDDDRGSLVNGENEIYGQLIDGSTGEEIGTNDFRVSDAGPDGDTSYWAMYPAVAYNDKNNNHLIAWYGDENIAPLVDFEYEIFGQLYGAKSDLALTKTDSSDPVAAGATLTYTLSVSNAGPDTARNVQVTDSLPNGLSYSSASGTGWSCSESSGTVTCTRSTLAMGNAPAISVVVAVDANTSGSLNNTALVATDIHDAQSSDNSDTESTTFFIPTPTSTPTVAATSTPTPVPAPTNKEETKEWVDNTKSFVKKLTKKKSAANTATKEDINNYLSAIMTGIEDGSYSKKQKSKAKTLNKKLKKLLKAKAKNFTKTKKKALKAIKRFLKSLA